MKLERRFPLYDISAARTAEPGFVPIHAGNHSLRTFTNGRPRW